MRTFSQKLALLLWALSAPALATTVTVSGRQLLVNCAPFLMRGVNYSPGAIGQGPGGFDWYSDSALLNQDIAAMKAMGVNTVRVYLDYGAVWNNSGGDPNNDASTNPAVVANVNAALNNFLANGIYVVVNYWLPYGTPLMSSPNPRLWEELKFRKLIHTFKGNQAVLMWVFGNENNASFNRSISAPQLFAFYQEAISAAKSAEAPPQPISVVLSEAASDGSHLDHQNATYLNAAPAVDLWGVNIYQNAGGFVTGLDGYTDPRPLFIAEFGQDAWNSNTGAQDLAGQASFYQDKWGNYIGARLSALNAGNKVVGACAFEWNDEWYKDPAGGWGNHDNGGFALANDNDGISNEEWYGLSPALAAGSSGPRTYRNAYNTLKGLWTAAPYNLQPPASCCPSCTATRTATPTATPDPCDPISFDNFEDLDVNNAWGGVWGSSQQDNACYSNVALGGHSGGGLTYGFSTVGNWSVLYSGLSTGADPAGNSGTGKGAVDLTPYGQVRFWVKASVAGTYSFTVASNLALSPGYGWYKANFNVTTGWTEVVLNLDAATFSNPGGNYGTWAQNAAVATQFTIVPPSGISGTLNLDDVRLTRWCGVPTATMTMTPFDSPTATPNPCLPQMIDDFEDGNAVNAFGGVWNWSQQVGGATVAVAAGGQSGQGLRWTYDATAGWSVLYTALNPGADPAGNAGAGSGNRDISADGQVRFWVKGSAAGNYVFKVASNTNDSNSYAWYQAPFSVSTAWTQVSLDLTEPLFSQTGNDAATWAQTLTRATQFVIQPVTNTAATVQIDGLQLLAWCGLPSPTPTPSPSKTRSSTSSPTATQNAASPTPSPSPTPTGSATPSKTLSKTPSPSSTATPNASATRTVTASPSASMTPSATASPTSTSSSSSTRTATFLPSLTRTPSPSATVTESWTPVPPGSTLTDTPTISATNTPSSSATLSATSSPTLTATGTSTLSDTASITPSVSVSPTVSVTATPSPRATASPSSTASSTPAPSKTVTLTASPSPQSSATRTATATPSVTGTPLSSPSPSALVSPLDQEGPNRILSAVPVPNPGPRQLALKMDGSADGLHLELYSDAMTLLQRRDLTLSLRRGWCSVPLPSDFLQGLPNGLYYLRVLPQRQGRTGMAGGTAPIVLMR